MNKIKMGLNEVWVSLEDKLPNFVKAVNNDEADTIMMTSAAFFDDNELLGKAIQYACKHGKIVTIIP